MDVTFPIFKIPAQNKESHKKWGWGWAQYYWDERNFEEHKLNRKNELSTMINYVNSNQENIIPNLIDKVFFEVKIHPKALSKSAQPKDMFDDYNIDVYAHRKDGKFSASAKISDLNKWKEWIDGINTKNNKNLLSAIIEISPMYKEEIITEEIMLWDTVFAYFQNSLSDIECSLITEALNQKYDSNLEYFISNSSSKILYWEISSADLLEEISKPMKNVVNKIEKEISIKLSDSEEITYNFDDMKITAWELDAKVALFDSWIEKHSLINWLILWVKEGYVEECYMNRFHWTMVWSRIMFGNNILEQISENNELVVHANVYDIQIIADSDNPSAPTLSPRKFIEILTETIPELPEDIKIINLSLNYEIPISIDGTKDYLTREIDALAEKYKVLFVISSWNYVADLNILNQYPEHFELHDVKIATPWDTINTLTVWSIADQESTNSIAKINEPSPFSRVGIEWIAKPDVCHYWGNIDKFWRHWSIWVTGLWKAKDKIVEHVWTSFSTPIVSQIAAEIYSFLQKTVIWEDWVPVELVKAMLIHSANYELPDNSLIPEDKKHLYTGYWIPDFNKAVNCFTNSATYTYIDSFWLEDTVKVKKKINSRRERIDDIRPVDKQRISFTVPRELEWRKIRIRCTLVYISPVSPDSDIEYALSNISLNMHYFNSNNRFLWWELVWWKMDFREDRWTVKCFEKNYVAFKSWERQIRLDHNLRGSLTKGEFIQNYALVISIEDIWDWEKVNLHDIISTQYPQYVQIKTRVQQQIVG